MNRIIATCMNQPGRLQPAHELAAMGYSLLTCILVLLRFVVIVNCSKIENKLNSSNSHNGVQRDARKWLRLNCFAQFSPDEALSVASEHAREQAEVIFFKNFLKNFSIFIKNNKFD